MTFLCVPIFVDSSEDVPLALDRATRAVEEGARLIEWRLDAVAEETEPLPAVERLLAESPAPCIVTIRSEDEGGTWAGDEQERISLLEAIGTGPHPPAYIDLESKAWRTSANLRQKVKLAIDHSSQVRDISTRLILSSHDFGGRPPDLMARIADMAEEESCAVGKLVFMARSVRDCLELFDLLATRIKPMIMLAMGEYGLPTRVLAPKFGGFLTFAASDPAGGTAPGQPTVDLLRDTYRFDDIGPRTAVYGVVGHPVAHSLGPKVHNAGFTADGVDAVYLPLPVAPGWESVKATVGELVDHPRLDFGGCSVTLPHKENLLRFAQERGASIDPVVERAGAANTLVVDRGEDGSVSGLRCLNTDVAAAMTTIRDGLVAAGRDASLAGVRVGVLGAGGVARGLVAGLDAEGASVVVWNRNPEKASDLAESFGDGVVAVDVVDESWGRDLDVIVNATPVGMAGGPDPTGTPIPSTIDLGSMIVMDTVYAPRITPLLQRTLDEGGVALDGMAMFTAQAEAQYHAWIGHRPPAGLFDRVVAGPG